MKYKSITLKLDAKDSKIYGETTVTPDDANKQAMSLRSSFAVSHLDAPDLAYSQSMAQAALTLHAYLVNEFRDAGVV